jgi:hypothetical protein
MNARLRPAALALLIAGVSAHLDAPTWAVWAIGMMVWFAETRR